jgi:hypothetical protein
MSNLANILREESLVEELYQEMDSCEWEAARATIKELKTMFVPVERFERDLATAMDDEKANNEPEDFTNSTVEKYGL